VATVQIFIGSSFLAFASKVWSSFSKAGESRFSFSNIFSLVAVSHYVNAEFIHRHLAHLRVREAPKDGLVELHPGLTSRLFHNKSSRTAIENGMMSFEVFVENSENRRRRSENGDGVVGIRLNGKQQLWAQTVIKIVPLRFHEKLVHVGGVVVGKERLLPDLELCRSRLLQEDFRFQRRLDAERG